MKSLELFEKVQDDAVEKMALYLNQLWFKCVCAVCSACSVVSVYVV